jgi:hypothetical protein
LTGAGGWRHATVDHRHDRGLAANGAVVHVQIPNRGIGPKARRQIGGPVTVRAR